MSQVHGVLVLVALLWGLNPPVMKLGLEEVPPMAYNAIRMVAALAVGWVVFRRAAVWVPLRREDLRLLAVSSFGFFSFQIFFTFGVQLTTAGNASLILGLLPVSVAIINRIHGLEGLRRLTVAGIAVSLLGVLVMVWGAGKEFSLAGPHVLGGVLLLCAQLGYGYYTVFSRLLLVRYSPYQVTAYVILTTTVLFVLVALPDMLAVDWSALSTVAWSSVLYSGVFPLSLANGLWVWATGKVGSTTASLYNNLAPVFAVAAGYAFLGEAFGVVQALGAGVIFAGLYLTRWAQRRP